MTYIGKAKETAVEKPTKPHVPEPKPKPAERHVFGPFKRLPPTVWAPIRGLEALKDTGRTVVGEHDSLHKQYKKLAQEWPVLSDGDWEQAS